VDGSAKLHVIRKGLEVRRKHPELFHGAKYTPLYASAGREQNVIAFSLSHGGRTIVAVAPRLFSRLMDGDDLAPLGDKAWGESAIVLDQEAQLQDALTGMVHRGRELRLAQVLKDFPVALLVAPA
jgi:(1->4)-alpha-D-glucan 1-alpha-D-glucosylmutase